MILACDNMYYCVSLMWLEDRQDLPSFFLPILDEPDITFHKPVL